MTAKSLSGKLLRWVCELPGKMKPPTVNPSTGLISSKRFILLSFIALICAVAPGCGANSIVLKYRMPETTRRIGVLVIEGHNGTRPINTRAEYGTTQTYMFQQHPVFKVTRIGHSYREGSLPDKYYKTDMLERVAEATSEIFSSKGLHAEVLNLRDDADELFGTSIDATVDALAKEGNLDAVLLVHLRVYPGVIRQWVEAGGVYYGMSEYKFMTSSQPGITLDTDDFLYSLPSKRKLLSWADVVQFPKDSSKSDELLHEEALRALAARLEQRFP